MEWISFAFFAFSGAVHVTFFVMESFIIHRPGGHRILGVQKNDYPVIKAWAFNLGFYNLFFCFRHFLWTLLGS